MFYFSKFWYSVNCYPFQNGEDVEASCDRFLARRHIEIKTQVTHPVKMTGKAKI
jgi:hypothetical protein